MTVIAATTALPVDPLPPTADPCPAQGFAQLVAALMPVPDTDEHPGDGEELRENSGTVPDAASDVDRDDTSTQAAPVMQPLPVVLLLAVAALPVVEAAAEAPVPSGVVLANEVRGPSAGRLPGAAAEIERPGTRRFSPPGVKDPENDRNRPSADNVDAQPRSRLPVAEPDARQPLLRQGGDGAPIEAQPSSRRPDSAPATVPAAPAPPATVQPTSATASPAASPIPAAPLSEMPEAVRPSRALRAPPRPGQTVSAGPAALPERPVPPAQAQAVDAPLVLSVAAPVLTMPESASPSRERATPTVPALPEAPSVAANIATAAPDRFDIATAQLGAVRVTLETREARVTVQLTAETPAAGQMLAAHPARLADAVASGGQRLDALAVDVRGGGQGGRQPPEPRHRQPALRQPGPARVARADRFA